MLLPDLKHCHHSSHQTRYYIARELDVQQEMFQTFFYYYFLIRSNCLLSCNSSNHIQIKPFFKKQ